MSKRSKKLTAEEREKLAQQEFEERKKLAQEIIELDKKLAQEVRELDSDLDDLLGPSKNPRKSFKPPLEKLTNYHLIVEASVFWASRQSYLEIIQNFLSRKIDGETFTSKFFQVRTQDLIRRDELKAIIEDEIRPIPDLWYTAKAEDFVSAIGDLYLEIDRYDPDLDDDDWDWTEIAFSERQLRSVIQERFVPEFQKSCDLKDSFFQPQVDLDPLVRRSYLLLIGLFLTSIVWISLSQN